MLRNNYSKLKNWFRSMNINPTVVVERASLLKAAILYGWFPYFYRSFQ